MTGLAGPIRARSDRHDRLIEADEPLARLQLRSGGDLPGVIAIPALLELVRKARRHRVPLARTIRLFADDAIVAAWACVAPGRDGSLIELSQWRPDGAEGHQPDGEQHIDVVRHLSAGQVWLDPDQRIRASDVQAPELIELQARFSRGVGKPWTDFVRVEGNGHRQPLHWRLLDGATVTIDGGERRWRVHLSPQGSAISPIGFELHFVPVWIDAVPEGEHLPTTGEMEYGSLLGQELAPALRQPINRIIANAETIRTRLAGPLPEQYAAYAADIANAGRHLLNLVEDLADLEAVEAPGFSPAPDRIDLAEVGRQAAGILSVRAKEKRISLASPPAELHTPAVGEFRRVLQVLLNLVSNAIRYSPEDSLVTLECGSDGREAWITVQDEGAGLDSGQAGKVFTKFERLGRKNDGGSGLGLYISRRLARAMGGDLTVQSTPGQGARFRLALPAGVCGQHAAPVSRAG